MDTRSVLIPVCLALCACGSDIAGAERTRQGPAEPGRAAADVPEGAIRVRDDFFMVPLDEKVNGCRAHRAFSPTAMVPQAIYYRTADGRFVMNRAEAVCD